MHLGGRKLCVIPYRRLFQSGFAQMDVTIIWPHLLTVSYTMLGVACSCSECCVLSEIEFWKLAAPFYITLYFSLPIYNCSAHMYCLNFCLHPSIPSPLHLCPLSDVGWPRQRSHDTERKSSTHWFGGWRCFASDLPYSRTSHSGAIKKGHSHPWLLFTLHLTWFTLLLYSVSSILSLKQVITNS